MDEKEKLLAELEFKHSLPPSFYLKITIAIFIAIYLAIHTGEILFGKNGIQVLEDVLESKKILINQVKNLKKENAKLQKKYFETLSLKPQVIEDLNLTETENNNSDESNNIDF